MTETQKKPKTEKLKVVGFSIKLVFMEEMFEKKKKYGCPIIGLTMSYRCKMCRVSISVSNRICQLLLVPYSHIQRPDSGRVDAGTLYGTHPGTSWFSPLKLPPHN